MSSLVKLDLVAEGSDAWAQVVLQFLKLPEMEYNFLWLGLFSVVVHM